MKCVLNILQCPTLSPFDWMLAFTALTLPHSCADHIPVLQNPQVLSTFDDVPAHTILDAWLKLLGEAVVHGIFAPHQLLTLPPPLPGLLMT